MNIGEAMLFKNILRINDDANSRITYGVFKLIPKKNFCTFSVIHKVGKCTSPMVYVILVNIYNLEWVLPENFY